MSLIALAKKLTTIPIGERPFTEKEVTVKRKKEERVYTKNIPFIDKKNKTVTIPINHITEDQRMHLERVEQHNARSKSVQAQPNRPVKNGSRQGWFQIGNKKIYARSDWERKYAFYLECSKSIRSITDWEYEPEIFYFDGIKRGTNNYKPDFKIYYKDGSVEFHEVKGFYDSKSITKIKRMKKYHPEVKLVIIDKVWFQGVWKLYKERYEKMYGNS